MYFFKNLKRYSYFITFPLFGLTSYCFFNIQNKNIKEYLLLLLSLSALINDSTFSLHLSRTTKYIYRK